MVPFFSQSSKGTNFVISNRAIIQAYFIKANLIKCQLDRQPVSVLLKDRERWVWGFRGKGEVIGLSIIRAIIITSL